LAGITAALTIIFGYLVLPHSDLLIMSRNGFEIRILYFALYAIVFIMGLFTGSLIMARYVAQISDKHKKMKRQLEKTSIGADDSDLRVKTLENKVKTLENALDKAMENKEQAN
jgi:hypothetical protein